MVKQHCQPGVTLIGRVKDTLDMDWKELGYMKSSLLLRVYKQSFVPPGPKDIISLKRSPTTAKTSDKIR